MRTSGTFVGYRGDTYRQAFVGSDWSAVRTGGLPVEAFPDAIESGEDGDGSWVKLPSSALTRVWKETVHARWRGAEVTVEPYPSETEVILRYIGSPAVAAELGMEGSQYDTWRIVALVDEVEVVDVEVRELG